MLFWGFSQSGNTKSKFPVFRAVKMMTSEA
jgi:hypothetical protein